jgi:hypothetical protein
MNRRSVAAVSAPSLDILHREAQLTEYHYPSATFDGLNLETRDPHRLAGFWCLFFSAGAFRRTFPDHVRLDPGPGRPRTEILRLTPAASPVTGVDRVHPDVRLDRPGPEALLAAGAVTLREPGKDPWWVLADPEGNQFCAYPGDPSRPGGIFELVVKCRRPHALARWWGWILGGSVADEGEAAALVGTPEFPWDQLLFDRVPAPGPALTRLTWTVRLRDPHPEALLRHGAILLRPALPGRPAWILADPEGNVFRALPS